MPIDRPIFIVGPHRSGSTLLYRELVKHPDIGYLNLANRRLPFSPRLAHLLGRLRPKMTIRPMEAQRFWDRFRSRDDDVMDEGDATPRTVAWYRNRIDLLLALRGTPRFLAKYPRLSLRLPWLEAVFPDAIFLHLTRDWRAVVSSTVERMVKRKGRGGEWFGVRIPGWRDMCDVAPAVAAGHVFVAVMGQLDLQRGRLGDRCRIVRYEDLCRDPSTTVGGIADWSGLARGSGMEQALPARYESANWKWPELLSREEIETVRSQDPDLFARFEDDG